MQKIFFSSIFFLLVLSQIPVSQAQTIPIIDGIVGEEWDDAAKFSIEMTNGKVVDLRFFYTDSDMYILVVIDHSSAENTINLNTSDIHDYFGIEFDLNGDGVIMGTSRSPDDLIIIDYDGPGYKDMFMKNFKAYEDVKNEGSNDGEGASGTDGKNLIWEFRKPLDSGDTKGYDISLKKGDKFQVMLAFWDDKYPNTAAGYTNKFNNNQQFLTFIVGELNQSLFPNLLGVIVVGMAYFGTNFITKSKKIVQNKSN